MGILYSKRIWKGELLVNTPTKYWPFPQSFAHTLRDSSDGGLCTELGLRGRAKRKIHYFCLTTTWTRQPWHFSWSINQSLDLQVSFNRLLYSKGSSSSLVYEQDYWCVVSDDLIRFLLNSVVSGITRILKLHIQIFFFLKFNFIYSVRQGLFN